MTFHDRSNGFALSRDLKPRLVALSDCQPLGQEARRHPPAKVRKLARSLDQFGFVYPILRRGLAGFTVQRFAARNRDEPGIQVAREGVTVSATLDQLTYAHF